MTSAPRASLRAGRATGRHGFIAAILAVVLFGSAWIAAGRGAANVARRSPAPNLVLISVDALRADRLNVYGNLLDTSPELAALAADGVVFDSVYYNGGGTLPSHMTLLTSLHPVSHGLDPSSVNVLPGSATTLAEVLARAGYRTAAFVDPGWLNPKYGFGRGFELFDDEGLRLRGTLPKAMTWIDGVSRQPFFVFLHTYDVHSSGLGEKLPYDCPGDAEWTFVPNRPAGYDGCGDGLCGTQRLRAIIESARSEGVAPTQRIAPEELATISRLYDGCVHYVDGQIGSLVRYLRARKLLERTLVVIVSDHGEEFGEHGSLLHDQGGYEEIARIPWILRLPGRRLAGTRVEGLAAMVDVMPTILDLMGLPIPEDAQGESWARAIESRRTSRGAVHMYSTLRVREYKYFSDEARLFDLSSDPAERYNVYDQNPHLVGQLEPRLRHLIEEDESLNARLRASAEGAGPVQLDDEEIARLRALGYLR